MTDGTRTRSGVRSALAGMAATAVAIALLSGCIAPPLDPSSTGPRIDLRVLVISAGDDGTDAMKFALELHGVPYTEVDLLDGARPVIDEAFLAPTTGIARHSQFQAVVMPQDSPVGLTVSEREALTAIEQEFGLRQVDSYVWPAVDSGLAPPIYSGTLDGSTATVTTSARSAEWSYLDGTVPFDDVDPVISETYGYLSEQLPDDPGAGTSFEPILTIPVPGSGVAAPVIGVHRAGGRERLVITAAMNGYMTQFLALSEGIVNWATKGVHLGSKRNYFTVHADDVLLPDDRWSVTDNCTPGEDCPPGVTTTPIRMSAADAGALRSWQDEHDFLIDLVFNGKGHEDQLAAEGSDPLGSELLANRASFRWVNHTFSHEYLGCEKDFTLIPWVCRTDGSGVVWASAPLVQEQIADNIAWASAHDVSIDPRELVTGEHSGLRRAPEEPSDNPSVSSVLAELGIETVASDRSREPGQRRLGDGTGPRTLPRYPLNVFYNVATGLEQTDEYNWIYNSVADGGSGICETDPNSTCIEPLDPETGFDSYIRPLEARLALLRVLNGWPYPHYAHQSNLAEERILLPVLEDVLGGYRAMYADNAPIINPSMMEATEITTLVQSWRDELATGTDDVTGYIQNGVVTVSAGRPLDVPLTVPMGSVEGGSVNGPVQGGSPFGSAYAGSRSAWTPLGPGTKLSVELPD
ncbi:MAG: hypothetical protein ACK4V6_02960 [Microthrixaceae bacterium]